MSKGRTHPWRNAGTADQVLKSWIAAERVESGIHPDPRYSGGSLQERLLERVEGLLFLAELGIGSCNEEPANVALFCHFQSLAEKLFGSAAFADARQPRG